MIKHIAALYNTVMRLFFPPKCIFCKASLDIDVKEGLLVCTKCLHSIPCVTKSRNNASALLYKGGVIDAIHKFKFKDKRFYGATLGHFMKYAAKYAYADRSFDYVIPVPLGKKRMKSRGYNQAEILAMPVAEALNIQLLTNVLVRVKDSTQQSKLNANERRKNIIGAFAVKNKELIKGKSILLVDDVYTTGSTINECVDELKKCNIRDACCLTLAATR